MILLLMFFKTLTNCQTYCENLQHKRCDILSKKQQLLPFECVLLNPSCPLLQLAKIEEQQRAIHSLKTNLIDDLNARGVLSDPETQAVIKRHQEVGPESKCYE